MLDGAEVLTLLSEAPAATIRATGYSGRVVHVACTSSGRALLFDHDRPALDALLAVTGLARLGPNAPRTAAELWRRLERARAQGHAVVEEESEVDLVAVAAPVRDFRGRVVAALNVSGPRFRLGPRLDRAGVAVAAACDELSAALGDAGAPPSQPFGVAPVLLLEARVGAPVGVLGHVGREAARRRRAPERLGHRTDVVRARAAADAEVARRRARAPSRAKSPSS